MVDLGLNDKTALVTGGSQGIGAAIAMALAKEGVEVAICSRTEADLAAKAAEIEKETGARIATIASDLSQAGEGERVVNEAVDKLGRLDILVNNAGSAPGGTLDELREEDWQKGLQLKFMGYIRCTTAAIPIMQQQGSGRVVNVVGNDGIKSAHWELVPAACNAALLIVMQALGERYGRDGINISCLNPGPVATDRMNYLMGVWAKSKGIPFEQSLRLHEESIPIGRLCTAEEVASVALFLASDMATFVNATSINVDGGQRKAVVDTLLAYEKGEISPLGS
jgi:NAD(P)-dependent dehydrogenase (short-subunit alcohol dehydrogenase family)